jgi:hypothetical protein
MPQDITPLQTLALWSLLVKGGSGLQKDIKSTFKKEDRDTLVAAGLITAEKNKQRAYVLQVTDRGWHWAGKNAGAGLVPADSKGRKGGRTTPRTGPVLEALLARGGSGLQKDLKINLAAAERDALVAAGLINVEKAKDRAFILNVTDKGRNWVAENAGARPSATTAASPPPAILILQALLARLGAFMQAHDIALAEILAPVPSENEVSRPEPQPVPVAPAPQPADLRTRIRAAFLKLTDGKLNTRVRLADLRVLLADLDRATQDEAILAIAGETDSDLLQLDNRIDITDADREAALQVGTEPRHLLWISK